MVDTDAAQNRTKEEIYDDEISPLMKQIITICKKHGIAHVSSFCLDLEDEFCCTTALTTDAFNTPEKFKECVGILYRQTSPPLKLTTRDKDGNVTSMAVIFP